MCGALGGLGADKGIMRFERSRELPDGRVEFQCDGIGVLVCCVERVAQIHQKGVAVPTEAVLSENLARWRRFAAVMRIE